MSDFQTILYNPVTKVSQTGDSNYWMSGMPARVAGSGSILAMVGIVIVLIAVFRHRGWLY